jgi:hypothetical protein
MRSEVTVFAIDRTIAGRLAEGGAISNTVFAAVRARRLSDLSGGDRLAGFAARPFGRVFLSFSKCGSNQ